MTFARLQQTIANLQTKAKGNGDRLQHLQPFASVPANARERICERLQISANDLISDLQDLHFRLQTHYRATGLTPGRYLLTPEKNSLRELPVLRVQPEKTRVKKENRFIPVVWDLTASGVA